MNKKILLTIGVVSLVAITVVSYADDKSTSKDHLFAGNKLVQEKKYKEAIEELKLSVKLDPDNAQANQLLGLVLVSTGEFEQSVQYIQKALSLSPTYSGHYNLALVKVSLPKPDYPGAIESLNKALEINPKSYDAWHQLGKVHATTLAFDKAAESYKNAIALNPKFPDAYQGLASALYWQGNLSESLAQVELLRSKGYPAYADQLEKWIKDKESKKSKSQPKQANAAK